MARGDRRWRDVVSRLGARRVVLLVLFVEADRTSTSSFPANRAREPIKIISDGRATCKPAA
jgi:hypothetical protein